MKLTTSALKAHKNSYAVQGQYGVKVTHVVTSISIRPTKLTQGSDTLNTCDFVLKFPLFEMRVEDLEIWRVPLYLGEDDPNFSTDVFSHAATQRSSDGTR